ncbi:MAG TPA: xylulokinase [Armatimonadota bacterium]|jgi:xylulokinase
MAYLLGLDIGTSGTKTLLIDETGRVVARALAEYPLSTPRPNWAEQDPAHWWQATVETIRSVLAQAGVDGAEVSGVGLSGQMHGSVFLDAQDQVIRPALLWCDQRTGAQCDWITATVGRETLVAETCNPVLTGFQAPKIIWLRDNEPENYARVRRVLLPKDYIRLLLTGEYATEVSDASGTSLLNVPQRRWSTVVLDKIGVPREWLPTVYESPEVSGRITGAAAELTGLRAGTPVVGGGGDQAAGAVGNGIVDTGVVSSTLGTSGVVFAHLDEPLMDPELRTHTFCHAVPGKWHVMGVMLSAGGSLRWLRDTLCQTEKDMAAESGRDPYEYMTEAAASVATSEGLIFLPYLTGERVPYPNPNAKGVFFGLTLRHTKAHMIRAVLEGVALGMRDSFEIMKALGTPFRQVRASGGGARSPLWRQIQADVTGEAHCTINVDEGPAFGVALLAGVGSGAFASVPEACAGTISVVDELLPQAAAVTRYQAYHQLYQALYPALVGAFDQVQALVERE